MKQKYYLIIGIIALIGIILISGCVAPEEINKKIAKTYRGLNSLSYEVQIIRTDSYEKAYTGYEIIQVQTGVSKVTDIETGEVVEHPVYETVIGDSHTLTGSSSIQDSSIFIEKPDRKTIIHSGSYDEGIGGGELIDGKWYYKFQPAGTFKETKQICNGNTYYQIPDGVRGADVSIDSTEPEICQELVQNSIWQLPAMLDDPTKFKTTITEEIIDGAKLIAAEIESVNGELFNFERGDPAYQKIKVWFESKDFRLVKLVGILAKSKKGTETEIGLSTTYTMMFNNMIFNPEIPSETFKVDLNKYDRVVYVK